MLSEGTERQYHNVCDYLLPCSPLSSLEQLEEFKTWHEYDMSEDNFCELEGMDIHVLVQCHGIVELINAPFYALSLPLSLPAHSQMRTLLG